MPYVPLDGKPWRPTMGLRPLDLAVWLEVDERRGDELRSKAALLSQRPQVVMAALEGSEEPARELLAAVVANLGQHHAGLVERTANGLYVERTTGSVVDPAAVHPLEAAARLVQEDLCLMAQRGAGWVLVAGCVCFPSRWGLTDKIGRDLSAIHAPVPDYERTLAGPTAAFFDRLRPQRPVWRCNWTLLDSPQLHLPEPERRARRTSVAAAADVRERDRPADGHGASLADTVWFRVERQTLRRLPDSGVVAFTIRTYVVSLGELLVRHPEVPSALRATLPTVPGRTLDYKGWVGLVEPLLDWLAVEG